MVKESRICYSGDMSITDKLKERIAETESFKMLVKALEGREENLSRVHVTFEVEPLPPEPDEYVKELGTDSKVALTRKIKDGIKETDRDREYRKRVEKNLKNKEFVSDAHGESYWEE